MPSHRTAFGRARPLEGLKILDFSRVLSGPFATMIMADLGADVIKVEDLDGADTTRHSDPFLGGESHYFLAINRNKRSIALNLKNEGGKAIARDLADRADVVVENFRPGVAKRLGLGYEQLKGSNPGLIYCSLSGFGQTGPLRDKIAFDLVTQAITGGMDVTGEADRPPVKMGLPLADQVSGLFAAIGILAAAERRSQTGCGAYLDIGMYDVGLALLSYMANIYFATGESPKRLGSAHPTIYPYNAFLTQDDYIVVAPFTQDFWRKFCAVIGREDLANDPRFIGFEERLANRAELKPILDSIMRTRPATYWLQALDQGDVPNGAVNSVAKALEMEQTKARAMVVEIAHPRAGTFRTLGTPFKFDFEGQVSFAPSFQPAPVLGQHTHAILSDILGMQTSTVAEFQNARDIGIANVPDKRLHQWLAATKWREKPRFAKARSGEVDALPLQGLRVLDLTRMFAGPYCGLILADLGADVVKVEEPRIGDPTRRNLPIVDGESAYFMAVNRGKRSVVLDLKTEVGRDSFLKLVETADVIVENFRPNVMERLRLGYDILRQRRPDIVVCSISGFGKTGPLRGKISFDLVNQAISGAMAITGEEDRPPVRIGLPAGDLAGGIYGAVAILAALRARRISGKGASIDLGLHDTLISLLGYLAQIYFVTGESPGRIGSGHHHITPYRAFRARDGYLVIAAFSQKFWTNLARAIGRSELAEDYRFRTLTDRKVNREELNTIIENIIETEDVAHWLRVFEQGDVPCAPIASVAEALESDQAKARDIVFTRNHPKLGPVRSVGTPFRADGGMWRARRPAPLHGQHTDEVLGRPALEDGCCGAEVSSKPRKVSTP